MMAQQIHLGWSQHSMALIKSEGLCADTARMTVKRLPRSFFVSGCIASRETIVIRETPLSSQRRPLMSQPHLLRDWHEPWTCG